MNNENLKLCPDCLQNNMKNTDIEKHGICSSCFKRKTLSKVKGIHYIPYVSLSDREKQRLQRSREARKRYNNKKRNISYTPYNTKKDPVLDILNNLCSENTTIPELLSHIFKVFPDSKLNYMNLRYILIKHNLPYKKNSHKQINKSKDNIDEEIENEVHITDNININKTLENNSTSSSINKSDRLAPVYAEVKEVLSDKYSQLKCSLPVDLNTDDYINLLQDLLYLCSNYNKIITARRDQHDITNAYQSDLVHEQENTLADEGSTYLSDKMNVLRNIRRYYEFDCNDMLALRPFLDTIDTTILGNVLDRLKSYRESRKNINFIPQVDSNMIEKYNWAISGDPNGRKHNTPILYTNQRIKGGTTTNLQNRTLYTFRVSARLSGAGRGAFSSWYSDYSAKTEDIALSYGKATLDRLCKQSPGLIYTDLTIVKLNR